MVKEGVASESMSVWKRPVRKEEVQQEGNYECWRQYEEILGQYLSREPYSLKAEGKSEG